MKLAARLDRVLENALILAEPGVSVPTIAERLYAAEYELMQELGRQWAIERLTLLLYRKRQQRAREDQPWLPGFEKLPRRIEFKDGHRLKLADADLTRLREYRKLLAARRDPRLEQLDKLIELVERHARQQAGITVEKVFKLEAK